MSEIVTTPIHPCVADIHHGRACLSLRGSAMSVEAIGKVLIESGWPETGARMAELAKSIAAHAEMAEKAFASKTAETHQ
jgi:hypothetical protein